MLRYTPIECWARYVYKQCWEVSDFWRNSIFSATLCNKVWPEHGFQKSVEKSGIPEHLVIILTDNETGRDLRHKKPHIERAQKKGCSRIKTSQENQTIFMDRKCVSKPLEIDTTWCPWQKKAIVFSHMFTIEYESKYVDLK